MISKPDTQESFAYTLGELLADGAAIDLLQNQQLVLWADGQEVISSTIDYAGRKYVASPLEPQWQRLLQLPAKTADFGTAHQLLLDIASAIAPWTPFDESSRLLVSAWLLSTWAAESVPVPPVLNLWGTAVMTGPMLEVLACLARRPLTLPRLSLTELGKVPPGVCSTVICRQPSPRALQQWLAAGSDSGLLVLVGGEPRSLRQALLVCSPEPVPLPLLNVQVLPSASAYRRLTESNRHAMQERFLPQLVRFRLTQQQAIASSEFDAVAFSYPTRVLARTIGAALEGNPAAQTELVAALSVQDEVNKTEQSQTPAAIVLEALLSFCHEAQPVAKVDLVTERTNAIYLGRHEVMDFKARKIGDILRNQLGLVPLRRGTGYNLILDQGTCARIHRLAASYHVLTLLELATTGCDWCAQVRRQDEARDESSGAAATTSTNDVQDVHNVHNVHDVHDVRDAQVEQVDGATCPVATAQLEEQSS